MMLCLLGSGDQYGTDDFALRIAESSHGGGHVLVTALLGDGACAAVSKCLLGGRAGEFAATGKCGAFSGCIALRAIGGAFLALGICRGALLSLCSAFLRSIAREGGADDDFIRIHHDDVAAGRLADDFQRSGKCVILLEWAVKAKECMSLLWKGHHRNGTGGDCADSFQTGRHREFLHKKGI